MAATRQWTERAIAILIGTSLLTTGCLTTTPRLVKIGLVAPFEGRYREIGNDVVPAVRLALREWALMNPDVGVTVELVTYDDRGDPVEAITQAERLLTDPAVEVVIGHWREETTIAAASHYASANIPLVTLVGSELDGDVLAYYLAPDQDEVIQFIEDYFHAQSESPTSVMLDANLYTECAEQSEILSVGGFEWGLQQFADLHDCSEKLLFASGFALPQDVFGPYWDAERRLAFDNGFREGSLGAPPGLLSVAAYEAAWVALSLVVPIEGDVPVSMEQFEETDHYNRASMYLYQWVDGQRVLIERSVTDSAVQPTP